MIKPSVRLKLDLDGFDEGSFLRYLNQAREQGVVFETFEGLGDTPANRRALYELNKTCSADIPGRGTFYDFDDYVAERIVRPADDPAGIIIALHEGRWVGMSASSYWPERDHVFAEMTGVVRDWRRKGLAFGLKVLALRYAKSKGASHVLTVHHAANEAPIALNRRLGFLDA
jgi:RimJ/RimL family protein N-acetyltransferase